jgi:Xaa-Pro aminopeptidase
MPGTDLRGAISLHPTVARFRRVPDPPALARLRAAARATAEAVAEVAPRARDDLPEAELARLIEEAMERRGCHRGSFPPIAASGGSVGTGHGSGNRGTLVNGTLVVVDVGCRVDGYVSDFTRTLPVGGRFSPGHRAMYEGVLSAQRAAEKACRPGVFLGSRGSGTDTSLEKIARAELKRTLGRDTMGHSLGHTVGMFVHDVLVLGPLQPGMVITIEPGAYSSTEGLRIEDTYVVTETGCERLTEGFPADPDRVEAAMQVVPAAR